MNTPPGVSSRPAGGNGRIEVKYEIIRDPLWNNIRVGPLRSGDRTREFQRLAKCVHWTRVPRLPYGQRTRGASTARAYTWRAVRSPCLDERDEMRDLTTEQPTDVWGPRCCTTRAVPFSHALEEIGPRPRGDRQPILTAGTIAKILADARGPAAGARSALIERERQLSTGAHFGSLDLDKIEYLKRDAHMCGVHFGDRFYRS